jgi:hypothetical protein
MQGASRSDGEPSWAEDFIEIEPAKQTAADISRKVIILRFAGVIQFYGPASGINQDAAILTLGKMALDLGTKLLADLTVNIFRKRIKQGPAAAIINGHSISP